jgi:hypothetical protein
MHTFFRRSRSRWRRRLLAVAAGNLQPMVASSLCRGPEDHGDEMPCRGTRGFAPAHSAAAMGYQSVRLARGLPLSHGAVSEYLKRARRAGLQRPLPEGMGDARLEALLLLPPPDVPADQRPVPDWAAFHRSERSWHLSRTVRPPCPPITAASIRPATDITPPSSQIIRQRTERCEPAGEFLRCEWPLQQAPRLAIRR